MIYQENILYTYWKTQFDIFIWKCYLQTRLYRFESEQESKTYFSDFYNWNVVNSGLPSLTDKSSNFQGKRNLELGDEGVKFYIIRKC